MGGGKKKSAKLPTMTINTGNLYGSGTAGVLNSFSPNDFQNNLVKMSEKGINQSMNQLLNPSYDSEAFKAETAKRNALAAASFENNLVNPLYQRGLARGSNIDAMSNNFASTLASEETAAMAKEQERVTNILKTFIDTYSVPYDTLIGLQKTAMNASEAQASNKARNNATSTGLLNSLLGGFF